MNSVFVEYVVWFTNPLLYNSETSVAESDLLKIITSSIELLKYTLSANPKSLPISKLRVELVILPSTPAFTLVLSTTPLTYVVALLVPPSQTPTRWYQVFVERVDESAISKILPPENKPNRNWLEVPNRKSQPLTIKAESRDTNPRLLPKLLGVFTHAETVKLSVFSKFPTFVPTSI